MIIRSRRVWISNRFVPAALEVAGTKINRVLPYDFSDSADTPSPGKAVGTDEATLPGEVACSANPEAIDLGSLRLVPGFIDIHTHGAYGENLMYAGEDGIARWQAALPSEGVTAFLPTTDTKPVDQLVAILSRTADVADRDNPGAEILGIHLEGPFVAHEYKGAQQPDDILAPSIEIFNRLQDAARGRIRIVTMAPELDPNFAMIRALSEYGVIVSMGHSAATFEQVSAAVANGARSFTHVGNVMRGLHHREPGVLGAALYFRDVYGEIIVDANHVNINVVKLFFTNKGADYGILVTDSLAQKGLPAGNQVYVNGDNYYVIDTDGGAYLIDPKEGRARLAGAPAPPLDPDRPRTLAGSTLKTNDGLRRLIDEIGLSWETALNAATINPARLLGLDRSKGRLYAGYDADIVALDEDFNVVRAWCRGRPARLRN
ncbi:MAG: N-acetylglucosamine-6-phosphate deacetylase [Clostridiaceae bacterium]|nr:N-acetylglucosamine-6-phosphate deacetylase [Clostridiaceae bacterium]